MKKPTAKNKEYLDWADCRDYVESILGYDTRDTLGKFTDGKVHDVEYRDFWHFLVDVVDVRNDTYMVLPEEGDEPWQQDILDVFHREFGKDTEYWVSW